MYDYYEELDRIHHIQRERYSRDGEMKRGSWQYESWGSASCASATMRLLISWLQSPSVVILEPRKIKV